MRVLVHAFLAFQECTTIKLDRSSVNHALPIISALRQAPLYVMLVVLVKNQKQVAPNVQSVMQARVEQVQRERVNRVHLVSTERVP